MVCLRDNKADGYVIFTFVSILLNESLDEQHVTWFAMRESVRSKSSTSCWKVGLRDGTACQQSLIIRYLIKHKPVFTHGIWNIYWLHLPALCYSDTGVGYVNVLFFTCFTEGF